MEKKQGGAKEFHREIREIKGSTKNFDKKKKKKLNDDYLNATS